MRTTGKASLMRKDWIRAIFLTRNRDGVIYLFQDTRVKRLEIRCKLVCRRISDLGTRQKHE